MLHGEHTTNRRAIGAAGCNRRASKPSATLKSLKKKQAEFWKWIKRCAFIQSCFMLQFLLVGGVMCLVPAHMAGGATECLAPPLVGVPDVSYNLPDTPLAGGASCLMQPARHPLGRGCLMSHATYQVPPWQGVPHVSCNLPGTALAGGASCLVQPTRYRLGRGLPNVASRGTTLAGAWHIGVRVRGALCCAASQIANVEVKITFAHHFGRRYNLLAVALNQSALEWDDRRSSDSRLSPPHLCWRTAFRQRLRASRLRTRRGVHLTWATPKRKESNPNSWTCCGAIALTAKKQGPLANA